FPCQFIAGFTPLYVIPPIDSGSILTYLSIRRARLFRKPDGRKPVNRARVLGGLVWAETATRRVARPIQSFKPNRNPKTPRNQYASSSPRHWRPRNGFKQNETIRCARQAWPSSRGMIRPS